MKTADTIASVDDSYFFCTDREGANNIVIQAKENKECHEQLKTVSSSDHGLDIIIGIGAAILGYFIGKSL